MNIIDVYKGAFGTMTFGIYNFYQTKYLINENNKLNNCKLNELKLNYELKLNELTKRIDKIDNKKWKIFKFIIFIIYNYFIL
jgi:hypothetical protein